MKGVLVDSNIILDVFLNAAVLNIDLITRDVSRYKSYFPTVKLIAP